MPLAPCPRCLFAISISKGSAGGRVGSARVGRLFGWSYKWKRHGLGPKCQLCNLQFNLWDHKTGVNSARLGPGQVNKSSTHSLRMKRRKPKCWFRAESVLKSHTGSKEKERGIRKREMPKKQESWQQFSFSIRIYLTCSNPLAWAPHGVCVIFDLFRLAKLFKRNSTWIAYILLVWFTKCQVVLTNMETNIKHEQHNKRKSCLSGFFLLQTEWQLWKFYEKVWNTNAPCDWVSTFDPLQK